MNDVRTILPVKTAAQVIGISRMTAYRKINSGQLQTVKRPHELNPEIQINGITVAEIARYCETHGRTPNWSALE